MTALPRDLLKTKTQRRGEVLANAHLKAGQANSQAVLFGNDLAVGATATQFRKVLVERNAAGAVVQVVGAAATSQADAPMPKGDAARISIGWIEVPASFVPGTTALTAAMLKKQAYHA